MLSHVLQGIRSGLRRRAVVAIISAGVALVSAAPASAFSSAPHEEMLADAMAAEGFRQDSIKVMADANTFMDLYQWVSASVMPYSGHGGFLVRLFAGAYSTEHWPGSLISAASRGHFDTVPEGLTAGQMKSLGTTEGLAAEWDRLRRSVWTLMREARAEGNVQKGLTVVGSSLHELQDFYAHTNWVEPQSADGLSDGPGLEDHGFGSYPTWFDMSADDREKLDIYGDSTPGRRGHGFWSTDNNESLAHAMNKDSPPRPFYLQAAITAYFASRQWVQWVRSVVNDDAFWRKMQNYQAKGKKGEELDGDSSGLFHIMLYAGRWEGEGDVTGSPGGEGDGGDLFDLRGAVKHYFEDIPKTSYRREFERLVMRLTERGARGELGPPVPSSQPLQEHMQIVVMRVVKMASVGAFGLGDPWPNQADMFALMGIDEQPFHTDVIHGHNQFSFGNPYEPFTKYKVIEKNKIEDEPVESIEVEVKTANQRWAGTDDDVSLRLGPNYAFDLDKNWHNDFEQGDRDTYSVPIDEAVREGMRVGDITTVALEKSGDGIGGGWKLEGMKLRVNGHRFYEDEHIEKWLEDDHRRWDAPDFVRHDPEGAKIPVWLRLYDDDTNLLNGDADVGDINPFDGRDTYSFGYLPGQKVERTTEAGGQLGGRTKKGGDDARVTLTVETLFPQLMGSSESVRPAPSPGQPDLSIVALDQGSVTLRNHGSGPAGPFRLRVAGANGEDTELFAGLGAGTTETRSLHGIASCESIEAMVDDLGQVDELIESNNLANAGPAPGCPVPHLVPSVVGLSEAEARERISNRGFLPVSTTVSDLTCEHIGEVVSQSPRGGTAADLGSSVTIRIGVRDKKLECR